MSGCGLTLPNYEDLSKEQDAVLNLPLKGSHLVTGPPGSGKTVMAIYRAAQLYEKHKKKTVLLMYNKLLQRYTSAAVLDRGVDASVKTFHSWFGHLYHKKFHHNPPQIGPWQFNWNAIFLEIGEEGLPEPDRVHIIVDEGQDMPKQFYALLPLISTSMTVFADENQRITADNSGIDEIKGILRLDEVYPLSRNYRNSRPIANAAAWFHKGIQTGITELPEADRPGDPPSIVCDMNISALVTRLDTWQKNHQNECIGVFLPYTRLQKRLYDQLLKKTKRVEIYSSKKSVMAERNEIDFNKPGIKVIAYPSTKGLEFDTVFIPLLERYRKGNNDPADPEVASQFYVMAARARRNLIFHHLAEQPRMVKALPRDLLKDEC